MIEARKISFQEAWDSSIVFFVDEGLEREIEAKVETLLLTAEDHRVLESAEINVADIADFLSQKDNVLDVILKDIGLSEEKFKRIISLLRKLGRIPGDFDSERSTGRIKSKIARELDFAYMVAKLLVDGKRDEELAQYIPRYYLDMLNYREIRGSSQAARRVRYKEALIGTYGAQKGRRVEDRAFVNFADGGGWLARKRDLERLVEHCHYFVNLQYLDMLEAIVLKHVPERYFS